MTEADTAAPAAGGGATEGGPDARFPDPPPGLALVAANRYLTLAFAAWSLVAVLVRPARIPLAVVDLVVFLAGCVVYLLAYATAVSRSRTDAIGLGALFFLTDQAAPTRVRRSFWIWTSVQTAVSIAAAAVRPFTPVAFGILVPIAGLALMGLWGARYGLFQARFPTPTRAAGKPPTTEEAAPSTRDRAEMEQNDRHG
jgi:hypothetical protein